MTLDRWHVSRAGIVNFWLYDEAEFELSGGKLIFRGANGSGKSVTMQSFLPLVLDGDKRPVRLDPFGSRDRKIEYYLLGEAESGTTDRTGYLYLEFTEPSTGKFLTVGIGLRARRGAQQIGFWGFAVTDQRRIGRDLFLYRQDLWDASESKIPLDRAGLEAEIGEGGKVVREQGEYRALVNQLLFGFEDQEAYKDLLSLLIQLRSPKLSKEHRPSVIYGILNDALPTLADEDLRPLSEVLEDLDEISDRLEDLARHRSDAQRLSGAYDQYNQLRLYVLSAQLVDRHRIVSASEQEVAERQSAWEEMNQRVEGLEQSLEQARQMIQQADTQIELIDQSEAMEKQRELVNAQSHLAQVNREMDGAKARRDEDSREVRSKMERLDGVRSEAARHEVEELACRKQLTDLAGDAEFTDHALYEGLWTDGKGRTERASWEALQRDLKVFENRLKAGRELGLRVRRQQDQVESAERAMSGAREVRDGKERAFHARETELDEALTLQEDAIIAWQRGLLVFPVADEHWRESLRRLQRYPEVSYMQVVEPIRNALHAAEVEVERERTEAQHEQLRVETEREERKQELADWLHQREPEPSRSDARTRARIRRQTTVKDSRLGGPLYALCEFRHDVDELTRAALETALHQAGLLDAWVSPSGWNPALPVGSDLAENEEDTWLRPNPLLFVPTLAEYLEPTPSAESGLTLQQVDDVLRTVLMADWTGGAPEYASETPVFITADGRFRMGPLNGKAMVKSRPEWIGVEARRKTRFAHIERLQAEIREFDSQIDQLEAALQSLSGRQEQMKAEFADFPAEHPLRAAGDALRNAKLELNHALSVEQQASEFYKQAHRVWRELQQQFVTYTSDWTRLRSADHFDGALECLRQFEMFSRDLKASFAVSAKALVEMERLTEEIGHLQSRIVKEDEALQDASERQKHWQTVIDSLKQLLTDLGVIDLVEQLQSLRRERDDWKRKEVQLNREHGSCLEARGIRVSELDESGRKSADAKSEHLSAVARLQAEFQLGFVDLLEVLDMAPPTLSQPETVVKAAQALTRQWKSRYESRRLENTTSQLLEMFSMVSSGLREYALEQRFEDSHQRWFVESLRDRSKLMTPAGLLRQLRQMEEEQQALINEKDRELYEQILLHSVGRAIRDKINRAEQWVDQMNHFMAARKTSSGLVLSLGWTPSVAKSEGELDTDKLVSLLRKSPETLRQSEIDEMMAHFRSRITWAKEMAGDGITLRQSITSLLDYRAWFRFTLFYKKGDATRRELTDARFNVLSGGEKAMAMYIPLFAATDSRYKDSRPTAPRILSLDEAFAGVDEQNMSDMFQLLTDMEFDYMMTSQVLWGCYETVPALSIYEVHRPNDADFVTLIPYYWNGVARKLVADGDWDSAREVAAAKL